MPLTVPLKPPEESNSNQNVEEKRLWIGNLDTCITDSDAQAMKNAVDGKMIRSKQVAVRWAHTMSAKDFEKPKVELNIPALIGAKEEKTLSRESQIQAIESKLKMMEHTSHDDFLFMNEPSTSSITKYYHNSQSTAKKNTSFVKKRHIPYRK